MVEIGLLNILAYLRFGKKATKLKFREGKILVKTMDAWEFIKDEVNNICMDVNMNTFMKMQCNCFFDNDSGNYVIYIKNVSTNYGAKYYVSKVIAESLVDPKSYANQLCRRIKKDFCIK